MIVVATSDFELYHEVVTDLRERGVEFTTVEPDGTVPEGTDVVVTGSDDEISVGDDVEVIRADPGESRGAIESALAFLRESHGRTVVGVDPGERPGIAVLSGDVVVSAFQVPADHVADTLGEELADAVDPLVRVGDGARLVGSRLIEEIDAPIELVDETGTTPYLGTGARGMGDVLAAVNIARIEGERIERRDVDPTAGELKRIKERSRERSEHNRAIDDALARRVAVGELTIAEALREHRSE